MSIVIGLTGGIGCGKSSVSSVFAELGATVIDTDKIAHAFTQPYGLAIPDIVRTFGANYLNPDGALNRPLMRELVFGDDSAKAKLEAILHPLIHQAAVHSIEQHRDAVYILLVVPLLLETQNYLPLVQRVLVVDCEEAQQISRTMARSKLTETAVLRIMRQQISRQQRLQHADDVILNQNEPEFTRQQIIELDRRYNNLSHDPDCTDANQA
ncbi:MAG: dephospho-CoA kinase [Sulfuriferula sp.]